ncbi:MAG: DNA-binding domain-containing protein [Gammaproteobacteria bacterium]|nr:DNA-binding domain-containing protein [Gammaproteobacteria bacterium]
MPELPEQAAVSALQELQRQFVREVLYRDSAGLLPCILAKGFTADRRLAIYRNNARENFGQALKAAFPLLLACMGGDEFRKLAWSYQRACPSPSGNLFHLGERLPRFLAEHLSGTMDEHLIDVARVEWAVQESLVAADSDTAVDLAALAEVPAAHQPNLRFNAHPSVRLLGTRYGVFHCWEALQAGQPPAQPVSAPENILVRRLADGVQLQRLEPLDLAWLEALLAGATLSGSATALPPAEKEQLGTLLLRWVSAGVITSFTVHDDRPQESTS